MSNSRSNIIGIVVGNRRRGKTSFIKDEILRATRLPKTLIVDTLDNPIWRDLGSYTHPELSSVKVPIINAADIYRWNSGTYRVFGDQSSRRFIMDNINQHVYNALLFFEDATKYVGRYLHDAMRDFLIDSKQKNLDIWLAFHSLAAVPPELVRIADVIVIFPTSDGKVSLSKYPFPDVQKAVDYFREVTDKELREYYEKHGEQKEVLDYRSPITLLLN